MNPTQSVFKDWTYLDPPRRHRRGRGERLAKWRNILTVLQGDTCAICQQPFGTYATNVDHIIPVAHGGTAELDNLQLVHEICNKKKKDTCPGCRNCRRTFTL